MPPDFSGSEVSGTTVGFDASASVSSAGISSNTWSFGDGSSGYTVGNMQINHTYAAAGTYSVTLTQVDDYGNAGSVTHLVTVTGNPTARITVGGTPIGGGAPLSLSGASSSDSGSVITSYSWSFGDGSSGSGATLSHAYAKPGTVTVTLTVTERHRSGCDCDGRGSRGNREGHQRQDQDEQDGREAQRYRRWRRHGQASAPGATRPADPRS